MAIVVRYGASTLDLEGFDGATVGSVRNRATGGLGVPVGAPAKIGGIEVDDDRVIHNGQTVEFIKPSGSKS
jgi:hypothetical protein